MPSARLSDLGAAATGPPGYPSERGASRGACVSFPYGWPDGQAPGSDETLADPFRHGLDPIAGSEGELDLADDRLDRAVGVAEPVGDLLGVGPGGQELEHLQAPAVEAA